MTRSATDGAQWTSAAARSARSRRSTWRSPGSTAGSPGCAGSSRHARGAPKLSFDERRGVWKANPIADWDAQQVWDYIARHDVPYNPLHDRGYESIGCAPCTLPGNGREGRWAGSEKTECGLHV